MRRPALFCVLLFGACGLALAATQEVRVQIWNETTNAPGSADELNVLTMGRDVEILASEEHVSGEITVPSVEMDQPHLIQAVVGGVKYNRVLMPGMAVSGPVRVSIYAATSDRSVVHAHDFRVLFGHDNEVQHVMLATTLVNQSSYTYVSDGPTWVFAVPDEATGSLKVELNRGTVPVQLTAEPAGEGKMGVHFDVQPGNTDLEVSYEGMPYSGKADLAVDFPFHAESLLLLTLPPNIQVLAPAVEDQGIDQENNVHLYGVATTLPGTVRFSFEGGKFVAKEEAPPAAGEEGDVQSVASRWSGKRGIVLLAALVLVLSLFAVWELFRRDEPGGALNLSSAELSALEARLSAELAELEARHARKEVSDAAFRDQRRRLTSQLALLVSEHGNLGGGSA